MRRRADTCKDVACGSRREFTLSVLNIFSFNGSFKNERDDLVPEARIQVLQNPLFVKMSCGLMLIIAACARLVARIRAK